MELRAAGGAFRLVTRALPLVVAGAFIACARDAYSPGADPTATETPILSEDQAEDALGVAQAFLGAAAEKDYPRLWSLLSPEAQSHWPDEARLSGFLDRKFGAVKLDFDLGRLEPAPDGASLRFPVSLRVAADNEKFSGPPLKLARHEDSWAVSSPGPLGRDGPVIGSPQPLRPEVRVPILVYHHVAPDLPREGSPFDTVTTEAFTSQLNLLTATGHAAVSVAELYNAFYYDLPLPPKPVILVFDDGYADAYQYALPLLRERGFRASVAAITGFTDQPGYLTWDQAREMSAAGVEFLSHTTNHANLALVSADEARREIVESRSALEESLGRPAQFLVYPYGEPFAAGSEEARATVIALLAETGYAGALTTSSGPPYISLQQAAAPYQLKRIPVSGGESVERFAASIEPTPTTGP